MKRLVFIADALIFGILGLLLVPLLVPEVSQNLVLLGVIFVAGAAVGLVATPLVIMTPIRWFIGQLRNVPARDILATLLGAFFGLALAALLFLPLSALPDPIGDYAPTVASIVLAVVMGIVFWSHQNEVLAVVLPRLVRLSSSEPERPAGPEMVVDTSAIIDGRIADVIETGFMRGTLLIPQFVLNELQHIADSADAVRRNRGRRGLDVLNRIQRSEKAKTEVVDRDYDDIVQVDSKLVALARERNALLVTNDFNLDRVAEIQGVPTLNINALANAVKSVVLPGEELAVQIIQEGKEYGQGVGFLDDGTMVVVENGRNFLGKEIEAVVTRVLTTTAGRMVFASPKALPAEERVRTGPERQAS